MFFFRNASFLRKLIRGGESVGGSKNYDLYRITSAQKDIYLYIARKRAGKGTVISLKESGDIIWEHMYPFGGYTRPAIERYNFAKVLPHKDSLTAFIIKGEPKSVRFIDDGKFVFPDEEPVEGQVYFVTDKTLPVFVEKLKISGITADKK